MNALKFTLFCVAFFGVFHINCRKKSVKLEALPSLPLSPELIAQKEELIASWQQRDVPINYLIIEAFREVPREYFTLPEFREYVYFDKPLPILGGQTISQPTAVVQMLDAIDIQPGQNVLEVGAGSGYNASLLGTIVGPKGKVFSTEIIPELADFARENLKKAGITNVTVLLVDGSKGYKKRAPFDRIIVTAGAPRIPLALIDQLADNGIMLIPADANGYQTMFRLTKSQGGLKIEDLGAYQFVPLTGKYGKEPRV